LLGFAAVNTGNNLIYLMASGLLGFMAISGILGKWNLSKIRISCTPPEEVYDGLPTLFSINLEPPLSGLQFYKLRLYPSHPLLAHRFETGRIIWL